MKGGCFLFPFLFVGSLISAVYSSTSIASSSLSGSDPNSLSPLDPPVKHDKREIFYTPDGTILLIRSGEEVLWSFSSGPSTYSSYTPPSHEGAKINGNGKDDFYIDFGEHGKVYIDFGFDKNGKLYMYLLKGEEKKVLLQTVSPEDFLSNTPLNSHGGIILGSKKTSIFLVNEETGKIINTITSDDNAFSSGNQRTGEKITLTRDVDEWLSPPSELVPIEKTLYVTRIDYDVKYINGKTGQLLWRLIFADFRYSSEGDESSLGVFQQMNLDLDNKSPINIKTLPPMVYRLSDRGSIRPLIIGGRLQDALPRGRHLSLPDQSKPVLEPMGNLLGLNHGNGKEIMLAQPSFGIEETKANTLPSLFEHKQPERFREPQFSHWVIFAALDATLKALVLYVRLHWVTFGALAAALILMAILLYFRHTVRHTYNHPEGPKVQNPTPKKRKGRKAAASKQSASVANQDRSSQYNGASGSGGFENSEIASGFFYQNISDNNESCADKRKIGKLTIFNKEIAKGSNGTIVLEGIYDGRPVAVKRLVRAHHDVAVKEIQNLIASDRHPNIVRWYGVEHDPDFVYLSLERCDCSLHDLISFYASHSQISGGNQYDESPFPTTVDFQLLTGTKEMELWRSNSYPSAQLLKLMRDIVHGVVHLHELGIVHRDLKPQNVLIVKDRSICAKISDMGISKRLGADMTSLTKNATGYGTSGWQAPEQLRHERQTRAVDLFSLGCILFFCITGGQHPFGESIERDVNIVRDHKDLFLIDNIPEATDLISRLLDSNPQLRPNALEVTCHPLFWNSEMRLSFLRDVSDRVELEDREDSSQLLESLENCGNTALGGKWDEKMDTMFINDIGRYRKYKYDSVRDLLRVIRNKLNHFRELSKEIQQILGSVPEGFDRYFSSRFPKLLIEVYKVTLMYCSEEEIFQKYFRMSQL